MDITLILKDGIDIPLILKVGMDTTLILKVGMNDNSDLLNLEWTHLSSSKWN